MHPYFLGGGTNPDRVRELSRSTESGLPGSHMETVQAEKKGRDLERDWFPRNVLLVGDGG